MQDFVNETLGMYGQSHVVDGDKNVEVKFVHHAGRLWKCVGEKNGKVKLASPYNTMTICNKDNSKEVDINEIRYI